MTSALQRSLRRARSSGVPANDNGGERAVIVSLDPQTPVTRVEVEVFDLLIGRFDQFAANDNQGTDPDPKQIRAPPRAA